MRAAALTALVVACAIAGALALAAAHDVRSWRDTLRTAELETAATPGAAIRTRPNTLLPAGLSGRLLATDRDREWLAALREFSDAYRSTRGRATLTRPDFRALERGEDALSRVTRDPDEKRASEAYNLVAVLTLREAFFGSGVDPELAEQAKVEFEDSIRLDQNAQAPKENLELALRALAAADRAPGSEHRHERSKRRPRGITQGPPNSGY
jgi:hypothetical protein